MKPEYKALKLISLIFSFIGGIAFSVSLIILVVSQIQMASSNQAGWIDLIAIIPLTAIMLSGLFLFGLGELIKLLIESIYNSRRTNEYLKFLAEKSGYEE